jgi:hypothetical protein
MLADRQQVAPSSLNTRILQRENVCVALIRGIQMLITCAYSKDNSHKRYSLPGVSFPQFGTEISLNNILLFDTVSQLSHVQVRHYADCFVSTVAPIKSGLSVNKRYFIAISTILLLIKYLASHFSNICRLQANLTGINKQQT